MNNALGLVMIVGLANSIKIIDAIKKNVYVDIINIISEKGGGRLNVCCKGSLGQIRECIFLAEKDLKNRNIKFQTLIIPNFDFKILNSVEDIIYVI